MVTGIHDEFFAPSVLADPFPYYGRLREEDPVHWNQKYEVWLITRYDDVVWVTRHPEIFSSENVKRDERPPVPPLDPKDVQYHRLVREFRRHEIIQNDPPEHTRLRAVINKYFTPKLIEEWRSMVRAAIDGLLDDASEKKRMEVLADLAMPLPLLVISKLLGIPEEDRTIVRELANKRISSASGIDPNRMSVAAEGIQGTAHYLTPFVDERLEQPQGDLLSLLAGGERSGIYSRDDVMANAMMLIDAGHDTTIRLMSNGTLHLLRHPDQWALLKSDPAGLAAKATEECLRYDPPLTQVMRVAAEDVTLGGKRIRKGDRLRCIITSANRDPRVFQDPDRFDITRWPNHHVAFGGGMHYCLGQYLARMEGQELFRALAVRFPLLRLVSQDVEYRATNGNRKIVSLLVAWN